MKQFCARNLLAWCLATTLVSGAFSHASAQRRARDAFRIMIVTDGASDQTAETQQIFRDELRELFDDSLELVEPKTKTDWTMAKAEAAVAEALADRSVDLVVAFGPMVGVVVGRTPVLRTPVLLPFAAPSLQGLPRDGNRSGRKNLTYITGLINFERELRQLREIVRFERIAFIVGQEVVQHITDAGRPMQEASARVGVKTELVIATNDAKKTLASIPPDAEAVYFGLLLQWSDAEVKELIRGINDLGLPSYAGDGVKWVEAGALATMESREDAVRRLRRAALYAQRVSLRERPETFDVSFEPRPELVINMATARAIAAWPRFEVMAEARMINNTGSKRGPTITLAEAMRDALQANLDLMAARTGVRAGKENVKEARGQWFPSATASGSYTIIDPDGANAFGQAERQVTWGVDGSQLIYSPRAHGNLRAQRAQQRGVVEDYVALRLDTMLEAAEAFINVLRAKNNERVNRDNLRRARRNLALAETRHAIGAAGREEVHRWQIEIADSRSEVIAASAQRNQAEIELNRILNRESEEPFQTPSETTGNEVLPGNDPRVSKYIEDPWSFKVFREFMAQEAIRNSPEIRSIDEGISAQEEILKLERRGLGIPDVSINGGFQHIPHVDGVGSTIPPSNNMGDPAASFPARDSFSWNIGIGASLTLFDGTQNYARVRRAHRQLEQLETQRAALVQRIEQAIRASLHQVGSSYANINLSRDAAEAAKRNLEMVTDSYQRGAVDIIRLVDAQNQALVSELAAANARYDFLIDALRVERASGAFTLEASEAERDDFIRRLDAFARERKPRRAGRSTNATGGPEAPAAPAEN